MKLPRLSIAGLMAVVGVVALDVAAARGLFLYNSEMLIGVALGALVLQFALVQSVRRRGRGRAFWVGFLACGLMAMMTLIWAMLFPEVLGITSAGKLVKTPGSTMYAVWYGYARFVAEPIVVPLLANLRIDPEDFSPGGALIAAIRAVIWFLPQSLIAAVGGLLAGLVFGRRSGGRVERGRPSAAGRPYADQRSSALPV